MEDAPRHTPHLYVQLGELVTRTGDLAFARYMLQLVDALVPIKAVHASKGKVARAEPVAALYEQGRVAHLRGLAALEEQMCRMTVQGYRGKGSPDRVDALVWALTELMVEPALRHRRPQVRTLR